MKELGMQVGTREYGEGDGMGGPPMENETIVVKAIRKGDWGLCNSIMSTYADESYQDEWREKTEDGETPWQVALTEIGRVELARLVREGEDVNEAPKTWGGNTVLHDACKRGRVDVVEYVVGEGGDVNGKGRQGFTPTVLACRGGMVEVVRLCLEGGGDWKVVVAGKNGREWAEGQGKRGEGVVELIDGWE
ncbi:hypothetical protein TrCOL_g4285 [Triparma columacea]|uniref:Ankyrin repeat protein n=1 Tax=Triparma columacea TaxID=722753 RepID=A0A9W7GCZ4_9STRA|nr:hypothetical protein TrCOL_g4285 [Triparma columacea]